MRTYVITGGTDGIGRGLGLHWLGRGDRVIAIASGAEKGAAFLSEASRLGAADRAHFLRADYRGLRAAMQASRCIDLLGIHFPQRHPGARTRYVLYNPMFTRTAMADSLPTAQRLVSKAAAVLFAQSVAEAIVPVVELVDIPPYAPVSAFRRRTPIPLTGKDFDPDAARRLDAVTAALLAETTA
ncbi:MULTISPECIES: SDR family oxidoreductase [Nocardia]|uniref:SDR family NAD(P)-dependent oxidoreductase n=1 Tax=Nocardia TaxID=1817 RepID=UPI000D6947F7|nr:MULTISPECIES: SDR family NAD(P)-dependent oxidoreductase [Nocardia]